MGKENCICRKIVWIYFIFLLFCDANEDIFVSSIVLDNQPTNFAVQEKKNHTNLYMRLILDYHIFFQSPMQEQLAQIENSIIDKINTKQDVIYIYEIVKSIYSKVQDSFENKSFLKEFYFFLTTLESLVEENYQAINFVLVERASQISPEIIKKFLIISLSNFLREQNQFSKEVKENICLKILFWVFKNYNEIKNIFQLDNSNLVITEEELFFFLYPLFIINTTKTYEKINFDKILQKYFKIKTIHGYNYLQRRKFPLFVNNAMAYDIISRDSILLNLLSNEENEQEIARISYVMKEKIIPIIEEIQRLERGEIGKTGSQFFSINASSIQNYLEDFVPPADLFKIINIQGGYNASKLSYAVWSRVKQNNSPLSILFKNVWDSLWNTSIYASKFINSSLMRAYGMPLVLLWPKQSVDTKKMAQEGITKLFDGKDISGEDLNKFIAAYNKKLISEGPIITLGDRNAYLENADFGVTKMLQHIPGGVKTASFLYQLPLAAYAGVFAWFGTKELINQVKNMINYNKYFILLKKLILYSNELSLALVRLYKNNNISEEDMIPEIIELRKLFLEKKDNHIFNQIINLNKNPLNMIVNNVKNFFVPGLMSRFYFTEFLSNKDIKKLYLFIGAVDTIFAKLYLLLNYNETEKVEFCIPKLVSLNNQAELYIKDVWYGWTQKPIKNTLELGEKFSNRNMLLVSPIAGGKTVLLSTILTALYLANMAIAPAEKMEYTYFINILDHLSHDYEVGQGMSKHLAERASMETIKNIAKNTNGQNKSIVLIDEILSGTQKELAIKEASESLPFILQNKNILSIITTHFPEIIKLVENKNSSLSLYYLEVLHMVGEFYRTYKLKKDDINNWWIRDPEVAFLYQQSILNKI